MNDRLEQLRKQQEEREINAVTTFFSSMVNGKNEYIRALELKQITAEEYEAETGETVAETLAQQYALGLYQLVVQARRRVSSGHLTQEQMEAIPGMPADPLHLDLEKMLIDARVAVVAAKAGVPAESVKVVKQSVMAAQESKTPEPMRVEAVTLPDTKVNADETDAPAETAETSGTAEGTAADGGTAPAAADEQEEVATNG